MTHDFQNDRLLYPYKVAEILCATKAFVYKLIQDGHLEKVRISNHAIRVKESSLRRYLDEKNAKN